MTLKEARARCATHRMSLNHCAGEYRVAPDTTWVRSKRWRDAVAYYTTDLDDAVATAALMGRDLKDWVVRV